MRRLTCATALGVRTASVVESLVFLGSVQAARQRPALLDNLVAKTRAQLDHRHPLLQWLIVAAANDVISKYPFWRRWNSTLPENHGDGV